MLCGEAPRVRRRRAVAVDNISPVGFYHEMDRLSCAAVQCELSEWYYDVPVAAGKKLQSLKKGKKKALSCFGGFITNAGRGYDPLECPLDRQRFRLER